MQRSGPEEGHKGGNKSQILWSTRESEGPPLEKPARQLGAGSIRRKIRREEGSREAGGGDLTAVKTRPRLESVLDTSSSTKHQDPHPERTGDLRREPAGS